MGSRMRPSLTDLPDSVVDEILVRLPLREAVRTSVLSRAWRHRWQSIPELVLEDRDLPAAAIDNVLLLHSAPVRRFSLVTIHTAHAHRWILSLSRRAAGHLLSLHLSFVHHQPLYRPLHSSVFSFELERDDTDVELAELQGCTTEALAKGSIPESMVTSFQRMTSLRMNVSLGDPSQISIMLCLMRSAPNLQRLFLMGLDYDGPSYDAGATGPGVDIWTANQSLELFASLRSVEVKDIVIQEPEMEFMRFILARAQVLETLTIISPTGRTMHQKLALMELWQFPRTSTRAKIILK